MHRKVLIILIAVVFSSCSKNQFKAEIPSYIHIESIDLETDSFEGSDSQKLTDAWITMDGNFLGAFELPCTIPILGDGEGAKARVDVVNGTITDVTVSAGGKGYSYGIVDLGTLSSGVSTSTGRAKLIPIIPPGLGHGSDVYTELGTDRVIVYARFDDSTKDFPIDTKFSQVGVVKNPTKVGTAVTYSDNTYSSLKAIKFDTVTGVPQVGEEIKQVLTVSPNVGKVSTGYIASYDSETKVLKYFRDRSLNFNRTTYDHTDYAGISTAGRIYEFESVVGSNNIEGKSSFFSGAISRDFSGITTNPTGNKLINLGVNFISGLSNSEINKGSGEIVYLDNLSLIHI